MKNSNSASRAINQIGWKYYNSLKKKAMEQEFSWSGLLVSMSIAFFVVLASAQALNFTYEIIAAKQANVNSKKEKVYYLENAGRINMKVMENSKSEYIKLSLNNYKA